jgi:hypothetical protein
MPPVGLEPRISASERSQTCAVDRAATGTGDRRPATGDRLPATGYRRPATGYITTTKLQICFMSLRLLQITRQSAKSNVLGMLEDQDQGDREFRKVGISPHLHRVTK